MSPPEPAKVPRVATFFALYPEALGLADGSTFCIAIGVPISGFGRTAMHLKEGEAPFWLNPAITDSIAISIRFHRGRLSRHVVDEHDERLLSVVRSVEGDSFPYFDDGETNADVNEDSDNAADDDDGTSYSVVEMSTQLVMPAESTWIACEPSEAIMGPTLTRCINGLMEVIDAYRFGEKVLLAPPARERIGPAIISTRTADPDEGGWDSRTNYVVNAFATRGGGGYMKGSHSATTFEHMSSYLRLVAARHPIVTVGSIQQDLQHAMLVDGDFRAVVIFAHTASEVLMDAALMAMQFEEGKTPEDAAASFAKPLKTRILAEFHERLGGTWGTQGTGLVSTWVRDALTIRHKVVHAGYLPFYEEARAAHDAYFGLGKYLRDRLAACAKRYPFSAGMLVTAPGFKRRGIRTKNSDTAIRVGSERLEEFVRWRDELIRFL